MKLWLYLHFPRLLLDNIQCLQPQIQPLPVALVYQEHQKEWLLQCNETALSQGLEVGHSAVLAHTLVNDVVLMPYSEEKESRVLTRLAERLYLSVDKQVLFKPQGIAIELDSLLKLYQGTQPLIDHLKEELDTLGVSYQMSLGFSARSAQCLACAGIEQLSTDRCVIEYELGHLPIKQLLLSSQIEKRLLSTGIHQLKQLWSLSAADIGKRFGAGMVDDIQRLKGNEPQAFDFFRPRDAFITQLDLVTEIQHWQGMLFPLKRLLQELEQFLYQRQKVIRQLTIELQHRDIEPTSVPLKLASDSWRESEFLNLLQLQMNRYPLTAPVIAIEMRALELFELTRDSGSLLTKGVAHQQTVTELVSRLQARLGEKAVYSPQLSSDPRPLINEQRAAQMTTLTVQRHAPRRPLWLLTEPELVQIEHWQLLEGPERIQSGWWSTSEVCRDYWLAKDEQQRLGWLFFEKSHWFLQGWFS